VSARETRLRIGIVDYGMGNRRSVEKALERVGAEPLLTADHAALRSADGLVLPGVGAFPQAMRNLRDLGLDELLAERVEAGVPLLGICLGMQLLFERSVELGGAEGLGLLAGGVERLPAPGLKLPHIGWNLVRFRRPSAITAGLPEAAAFYHVHTFAPVPARAEEIVGVSDYGGPFASVVADPERPLYGVQFHPEKSSAHGLALLGSFVDACAPVAVARP
jgi:imidazole glycerol-phosphate synthase subunit HisH